MTRSERPDWISTAGVTVPRIIYGTAWKKERTASLVEEAVTLGFRGIDTACQPKHYDEAGVGAALAALAAKAIPRDKIYLQTKFTPLGGQDPARIPYDPSARPSLQVAQSFERSRQNLGTDRVDGLVLHSPISDAAAFAETWRAMETIVDGGGARHLGISNCYDLRTLTHLYETARIKPALVQNRFYAQTGYDREIRDFCRRNGLLYQSFWTLTANPSVLAHRTVADLARRRGRTAAQIFFGYLSQIGIVPLTGTSTALHMRQDLEAVQEPYSEDECRIVAALLV